MLFNFVGNSSYTGELNKRHQMSKQTTIVPSKRIFSAMLACGNTRAYIFSPKHERSNKLLHTKNCFGEKELLYKCQKFIENVFF